MERGEGRGICLSCHTKKGFQTVTLYDPKTLKVENMLKEKGYWEGGSNSSIFTPSLDEGLVQPVGSGPVSAVSSPVLGNTLQEQLKKLKGKLPVLDSVVKFKSML